MGEAPLGTMKIEDSAPIAELTNRFEMFGVPRRTPVDDNDYQVPFKFTGDINKLTVELK